jgi:hypothetical protein
MHVDRQRFLLLATALAGCRGDHLAPDEVPVAVPIEIGRPGAGEPLVATPEGGTEGGAPAYDDALATDALRATCRGLHAPGPFCEGLEETKSACEAFPNVLEPDAAERAVDCLKGLSGSEELCGYDTAESCFMSATAVALIDPSSSKRCDEIVQRCARSRWSSPEMTMQGCQRALSAVKAGLEDRLVACMDEGCGIRRCIYDLADL